jgi:uncharacterized protein (TIGR03067 family)
MRVLLTMLLAGGCVLAADVEGTYTLKSASTGGKAAPAAFLESLKEVKVTATEVVFVGTDGTEQKQAIKLDAKSTPTGIDFPAAGKDEKGREGIYKLDKDELTIVLSAAGGKRPTDFKGDGEGVRVMVLTKKK